MRYSDFNNIEVNDNWSFDSVRSIEQWTHGYHRYPAKFLPNVVKKIIEDYSIKGSSIADPFAGCGTTLVEAKIHGYEAHGVDINPVAELITRTKVTPISPTIISEAYNELSQKFKQYSELDYHDIKKHDRIDYWFKPQQKYQIAFLYDMISQIQDKDIQNFFLVSLSHILKNCSRWLQSSTKPQVDKKKEEKDPFVEFDRHSKTMIHKNEEFYQELEGTNRLDVLCDIQLGDARNTKWEDSSIGTIITSPPYVTSYEYADIHQLTGYWFEYFSDISDFRQNFIGTSYSTNKDNPIIQSFLGRKIVQELDLKSHKIANDVDKYFADMSLVAKEMYRVLIPNGRACIVIGNTTVKDVEIKSAEVFWDLLKKEGFSKVDFIKRNIPHKLMPTIRDKSNGRFTKVDAPNSKRVYPNEYILIVKK